MTFERPPTSTPWGKAQNVQRIATGIWIVDTASHGGAWLDSARVAAMPDCFKRHTFTGRPEWYEEDCDVAMVAVAFPDAFPPRAGQRAAADLKRWSPERWEAFKAHNPAMAGVLEPEAKTPTVAQETWLDRLVP